MAQSVLCGVNQTFSPGRKSCLSFTCKLLFIYLCDPCPLVGSLSGKKNSFS